MTIDKFQRTIDYLRISITDKCNLRCIYCMPEGGIKLYDHKDILTYEEITRVAKIAARLGVKKIRITGGEPLVKRGLPFLISCLNSIEGISDISMTTNGTLLKKYAKELYDAGLKRVNVSLDTFKPDRYRQITRDGNIKDVYEGIEEAQNVGLNPLKLNMVPIRGVNDDEIESFARLTIDKDWQVRFIEFMPFGSKEVWNPERYISTKEIRERITNIGPIQPIKLRSSGPARYYKFDDAKGVLGFISPLTHHFCQNCNRLRLTSNGKLRPCLFSDTEIDIKTPSRNGSGDEEIERLLRLSIELKPKGHGLDHQRDIKGIKPMSNIGG